MPVVLDMTTAKSVTGGREESNNWTDFQEIGEDDGAAKTLFEIVREGKFVPRIRLKVPEWAFYHTQKNYFDKESVGQAYVDIQIVNPFLELGKPNLWKLRGYSIFRAKEGFDRKDSGPALNVLFNVDAIENLRGDAFDIEVNVMHPDEVDEGGV